MLFSSLADALFATAGGVVIEALKNIDEFLITIASQVESALQSAILCHCKLIDKSSRRVWRSSTPGLRSTSRKILRSRN